MQFHFFFKLPTISLSSYDHFLLIQYFDTMITQDNYLIKYLFCTLSINFSEPLSYI